MWGAHGCPMRATIWRGTDDCQRSVRRVGAPFVPNADDEARRVLPLSRRNVRRIAIVVASSRGAYATITVASGVTAIRTILLSDPAAPSSPNPGPSDSGSLLCHLLFAVGCHPDWSRARMQRKQRITWRMWAGSAVSVRSARARSRCVRMTRMESDPLRIGWTRGAISVN